MMSKEKKYLLYGMVLVLIAAMGLTFAYFAAGIEGSKKVINVTWADLKIVFNNGDAIQADNIKPGWSTTNTFSVENQTKNVYKYNIVIEDLYNTFVTTGFLKYKITSTDGGYNMTEFKDVPKSSKATNTILAYSVEIPANTTHNYTIEFVYEASDTVDQSDDMGKILSGKLYISKGGYPNLLTVMLRDNPTISERTKFSDYFKQNTSGTIYKTNKTEDGTDVYYYAGNTTNNWVKFGKETIQECTYNGEQVQYAIFYRDETGNKTSGFKEVRNVASSEECVSTNVCSASGGSIIGLTEEQCNNLYGTTWTTDKATAGSKVEKDIYWRIIRTNEDKSVRLLYSGLDPSTTKGYIGASVFNLSYNDPMYVGYMYGTSGSLDSNRTNTNDSTIKTFIDKWYENNLLTNYDKYISKTAIYCNDRSVPNNNYSTSTSSDFDYGAYTRLRENKTPSYKCGANISNGLFESTQATADKFSVSTEGGGNGKLTYPTVLMTADEVSFAGGVSFPEIGVDAWYVTNSEGNWIIKGSWWTLSPSDWDGSDAYVWNVASGSSRSGGLFRNTVLRSNGVRPVVSLDSCVQIKSGYGTPESPYEIDYENSCN